MKKIGFFTLTSIQAGIYICVSAIMAGHILYRDVGFNGALTGILMGSFILWLLSLVFVKISVERPKVLIEIVQELFGERGAKICGLAMGISLVGWFAIQTEIMAVGINSVYSFIDKYLWIALFGAIVTLNVMKGMDLIGRLADFIVPILLIIMTIAAFRVYRPEVIIPDSNYSGTGIICIIAFSLAGVIDIPTYFCASKSAKDGYIATSIIYLLILPAMAGLGLIFACYSNQDDFVQGLLTLGTGSWQICVVAFILFAGWTTNNGNLYSASLAIKPLSSLKDNTRTFLLGIVGSTVAFTGLLENFIQALSIMGIVMAALGGAMISYFVSCNFKYKIPSFSKQYYYQAFIVFGTLLGAISEAGWLTISTFGFLDSFLYTSFFALFYEGAIRVVSTKYKNS
jgi:cytosine permease